MRTRALVIILFVAVAVDIFQVSVILGEANTKIGMAIIILIIIGRVFKNEKKNHDKN